MKFIDLCSGIGGFRLGLQLAGYECIGFCENDKFAVKSYRAMYDTDGEWYRDDVTKIKSEEIPYADIWTFGFPCQDISVAGKQQGIRGKRSGIYFTIIDLIKGKEEKDKPTYLFIENVKNLLSINGGFDFATVLSELDEAGYDAMWQVLNSKNFGVPQNRERVFIIANLRSRCRREILPVRRKNTTASISNINEIKSNREYSMDMITVTIIANAGIAIKEATKKGFSKAEIGDSVNIAIPNSTTRRGRVGKAISNTIDTGCQMATLDRNYRLRRLTPKECFRLQGFPDEYSERARAVNSDSQLYKQAGNAVTVNVALAIALSIEDNTEHIE